MRKTISGRLNLAVVLATGLFAACTTVEETYEYSGGPLPKPDMMVVHEFAGSADDVQIDTSVLGNLQGRVDQTPLTEEEAQLSRKVADALAGKLVQQIQAMGLPAVRAGERAPEGRVVAIEGQILSISQGNRTERMVIGLGMGRTSVKFNTQVYGRTEGGRRLLESFTVDAAGSRQPGMAETMGAGAIAGNLGASAIASGAGQVGSEALGQTVEADAKRGGEKLAERLGQFFVEQEWMPPDAVKPELVP